MENYRIGIFDIEANNLYLDVTKGWCLVVIEYFSRERHVFRPEQMEEAAHFIKKNYDVLVGHNILDYDCPALKKLYSVDYTGMKTFDTLVASRLLNPDRIGGHSLKAWGKRLGILKGDYGEQEEAWDKFTEDMLDYCIQDVEVTYALFELMMKELGLDVNTFKDYGVVI